MKRVVRSQLFVDAEVQGAILQRVLVYWCLCFLFVSLPVWMYESLTHPDTMFYEHLVPMARRFWPMYLTMFALLPLSIWEALRMSNRFCGPVRRLLNEVQLHQETGEFRRIRIRDQDFWKTLADRVSDLAQNGPTTHRQDA